MSASSERETLAPGAGMKVIDRWSVRAQFAVAIFLFVFLAGDGLGGFLSGDDLMNLYKYLEQSLSHWLKGIALFWSSSYYRPVGALAYLVPYSLFGFHPLAFKAIAFAVLLLNLGLYFRFATRLTQSARLASFALLLVSYHSALAGLYQNYGTIFDITSYLFFFIGLFGYMAWQVAEARNPRFIGLAVLFVSFFLGLSCKETAVTLPAVLAAYDLVLGGGFRRDKWMWPLRGGWPILACSVLDLIYIAGKLTGTQSLANHVLYKPHFTLHQYALNTAHYMRELFYLPQHLPTPTGALWVLGLMLLTGVLLRSRLMLFSLISLLVTQLPVSFIAPRGAFVIYIPWAFWALYTVALVDTATPLLRRPRLSVIAFLLLAGLLLTVHLRNKRRYDRDYTVQMRAYQVLDEQLDRWRFRLPGDGHVLVTNDPFPRDWNFYDLLFLMSLHSGTTSAGVFRAKRETFFPAKSEIDAYDYIIDYEREWRLLKGPLQALTPASMTRVEQAAQRQPIRLLHGFGLAGPDRWRRAGESFGVLVRCPNAGVNLLDVSVMAPEAVLLSTQGTSVEAVETPLPPEQIIHVAVTVQAAAAGEVRDVEFRLRRKAKSVEGEPWLAFVDARLRDGQ